MKFFMEEIEVHIIESLLNNIGSWLSSLNISIYVSVTGVIFVFMYIDIIMKRVSKILVFIDM